MGSVLRWNNLGQPRMILLYDISKRASPTDYCNHTFLGDTPEVVKGFFNSLRRAVVIDKIKISFNGFKLRRRKIGMNEIHTTPSTLLHSFTNIFVSHKAGFWKMPGN